MTSLNDYLEQLYDQTRGKMILNVTEDKKRVKDQLNGLLGEFDYAPEFADALEEHVECSDYYRERHTLNTIEGLSTDVYVLTPKQRKKNYPAVLALHGHGSSNKEISGVDTNNHSAQHFALSLVKRGFKVFAPQVAGIGSRMLKQDVKENKSNSCYSMAVHLLMCGKTLAGLRVAEARRLIDYMCTYQDVQENRIGIMGFSGGGVISAYTSMLDERVHATVLSGCCNTYKGSILSINHCLDNYIPDIINLGEMPELIGAIAPGFLFVEAGRYDKLFPFPHTEEALNTIGSMYENSGAAPNFSSEVFNGGHEISGHKALDWLQLVLT
ncbi:dienelactone hydrolase family protein [Halobacillus salinarum]|uniref:Dienelactone hydrolase family protein n=1 Tax=Halobacillus salinarum TaxID=2932257 RepID=A0ABY4EHN0_9BACI|nr:alpha/beta hydrolase family protein [Halobacillus salinarum]UOQ43971.1 dienelactone hydrolase family protein [Halobacillus salinarum]